jgi:hypothetical protein
VIATMGLVLSTYVRPRATPLLVGAWLLWPGAVQAQAPNVIGTVTQFVTGSGCATTEPCEPVTPAVTLSFSRHGHVTARMTVRRARFRLHLPPGRYTITARRVAAAGRLRVTPSRLRVPRHGVARPHLHVLPER